jgi:hypothetical protein
MIGRRRRCGLATSAALAVRIDGAVAALLAAARTLPLESAQDLARRLNEWLMLEAENAAHNLDYLADQEQRFIGALRSVAKLSGEPPSTTAYRNEYKRRHALGDNGLPSLSAIIRYFGAWPTALAAAGLIAPTPANRFERRRRRKSRKVFRYPESRMTQALQACARAYGRTPSKRDYAAWYSQLVRANPSNDVPHYRTIEDRFGSWAAGLAAAGLADDPESREHGREWSSLDDLCWGDEVAENGLSENGGDLRLVHAGSLPDGDAPRKNAPGQGADRVLDPDRGTPR